MIRTGSLTPRYNNLATHIGDDLACFSALMCETVFWRNSTFWILLFSCIFVVDLAFIPVIKIVRFYSSAFFGAQASKISYLLLFRSCKDIRFSIKYMICKVLMVIPKSLHHCTIIFVLWFPVRIGNVVLPLLLYQRVELSNRMTKFVFLLWRIILIF